MRDMMRHCFSLGVSLPIVVLTGFRSQKSQAPPPTDAVPPLPAPSAALPEICTLVSYTGTVVRDGSRFALRDATGALFALNSTGRAWPFEGEDVRVTGYLDPTGTVLHIHGIHTVEDLRLEAV